MNGWDKWGNHVLEELKRLNGNMDKMNADITEISKEISALKVKSGVWGFIAGAIPAILALVILLIRKIY